MGRYISRWWKHMLFSLGMVAWAMFWTFLPPQWHHSQMELERLDEQSAWRWLLEGIGWTTDKKS